jgi:NADPH:quinone reductase-like Zn-dependent oxidoreductase
MLTNPLTAWVLASRARREHHRAVVLTAAAGALGLMLNRLFERFGISVINVIRSQKQAESLKKLGAAHVLDSTHAGFSEDLRKLSSDLGATLALDAVGGEMTGILVAALPKNSIVCVYGMLSNADAVIDPADLVFHGKRVEGFTMYEWLETTSLLGQLYAIMKVQGLVHDTLKTHVRARFSFADHEQALKMAASGASDGKILFVP